jgi:hypothetical protein
LDPVIGSVKMRIPPYGFGLGVAVGGTEVAVGDNVAVAVAVAMAVGPTVAGTEDELLAVDEHAANDTAWQVTRISTWRQDRSARDASIRQLPRVGAASLHARGRDGDQRKADNG